MPSRPRVYKFRPGVALPLLVNMLVSEGLTPANQILNYNGKVVGVQVRVAQALFTVPCFPSGPMVDLRAPYIWLGETEDAPYRQTVEFLDGLASATQGAIPCKPRLRVVEDGMVVGLLTETNQFVPVSPPAPLADLHGDSLPTLESHSTSAVDRDSLTAHRGDEARDRTVQMLKLEDGFFSAFRATARRALSELANRHLRTKIEAITGDESVAYLDRLERTDALVRRLLGGSVQFASYPQSVLQELGPIYGCEGQEETQCSASKYCVVSEGLLQAAYPFSEPGDGQSKHRCILRETSRRARAVQKDPDFSVTTANVFDVWRPPLQPRSQ